MILVTKKEDCHLDTPDTSTLSTLAENKKSGTKKDKNSLDNKIKKHTHFKCITAMLENLESMKKEPIKRAFYNSIKN